MLDKILRTLKAKGKAYEIAIVETDKKTIKKTNKKTDQKLKDANLIRRVGPDKGGHWEVV